MTNLLTSKGGDRSNIETLLDVNKQSALTRGADTRSLQAADGILEGQTYVLGDTPIFIAQTIRGNSNPWLTDARRSIDADQRGEWFEHVYPLGETDVPRALSRALYPLAEYAQKAGAFFVAAVVDTSYVVMPASLDKQLHDKGVSERYTHYINLRNSAGSLATRAMIYIDPGEAKAPRYTDSVQIGVQDSALPVGQLQYDVDTTGYVVDRIENRFERGVEIIEAVAQGQGDLGASGFYYGADVTGALRQELSRRRLDTGWNLTPR